MPEWIMKLSVSGGQARVTIPKDVIDDMGWQGVKVVVLKKISPKYLGVRRYDLGKEAEHGGQRPEHGAD